MANPERRFFNAAACGDCGRPGEEFSRCPWCGARIPIHGGTVTRLLALVLACALPLATLPRGGGAVFAAAALSALALALPRRARRHLPAMAAAAVAACALRHLLPGEADALGVALRRHLRWFVPAAALAAAAAGAARLPPIPAPRLAGRIGQVLKTPAVLALAAIAASVAACAPPSPATCAAAALCAAAVPVFARSASALFAAVIVFAFVAPMGAAAGRLSPCGVFALGLAACGLVQTLAAMKRRESESSNQP